MLHTSTSVFGDCHFCQISPLRLHGMDHVTAVPSPTLGQHNLEVSESGSDWVPVGSPRYSAMEPILTRRSRPVE